MKKFLAKYSNTFLVTLALTVVASPASVLFVHRPETPKELIK